MINMLDQDEVTGFVIRMVAVQMMNVKPIAETRTQPRFAAVMMRRQPSEMVRVEIHQRRLMPDRTGATLGSAFGVCRTGFMISASGGSMGNV